MLSVHDQQSVLSRRGHLDASDVPSFIRDALDELRADIERHHLQVQGPPFCIRQPGERHDVDVEVGWPVGNTSTGRVSLCALPSGLARRESRYDEPSSSCAACA